MTGDPTCEDVLMAAMAIADGERPPISPEIVEAHLARCTSCRAEAEALAATRRTLDGCRRRHDADDLWPALSRRIDDTSRSPSKESAPWKPFLVLVGVLVVARVLLAASPDAVIALKLLAVALVVATFAYARVNPFKIETGLRLGQE